MLSPLYVILGAALWATDTLFRLPLSQQFSPLTIVYVEHLIVLALSGLWALLFQRKHFFLSATQTLGALFIGVCGSALATVLFTASFQFVNPSVAILLQKVQPILVILMSAIFLNEKLSRKFWSWATLALVSAYFISFPDGFHLDDLQNANTLGILLSLGAAGLWALSTVTGKLVLKNTNSAVLSFWRFLFGTVALWTMTRLSSQTQIELPFLYADSRYLRSVFYLAFVSGFLGVTIYYRGLAKVPAAVATILELSFPLCAMGINAYFLHIHLTWVQFAAAILLLISMIGVSRK